MCKYAMIAYKPHYACFACRKTFKRRLLIDIKNGAKEMKAAKCPECSSLMADMGLDFKSPPQKDVKAWKHVEDLYESVITFHSYGCSGPGYIPKYKSTLIHYLKGQRNLYEKYYRDCLQKGDEEAKNYWYGKMREVEQRIVQLT